MSDTTSVTPIRTLPADADDDGDTSAADAAKALADGAPARVAQDGSLHVTLNGGPNVFIPLDDIVRERKGKSFEVETTTTRYTWPWTSIVEIAVTKNSPANQEAVDAAKAEARAYWASATGIVTDNGDDDGDYNYDTDRY